MTAGHLTGVDTTHEESDRANGNGSRSARKRKGKAKETSHQEPRVDKPTGCCSSRSCEPESILLEKPTTRLVTPQPPTPRVSRPNVGGNPTEQACLPREPPSVPPTTRRTCISLRGALARSFQTNERSSSTAKLPGISPIGKYRRSDRLLINPFGARIGLLIVLIYRRTPEGKTRRG